MSVYCEPSRAGEFSKRPAKLLTFPEYPVSVMRDSSSYPFAQSAPTLPRPCLLVRSSLIFRERTKENASLIVCFVEGLFSGESMSGRKKEEKVGPLGVSCSSAL